MWQALAARRRTLVEGHPGTLTRPGGLAGLLKGRGRLEEAEPLSRQALEAGRRTLGEKHPDPLTRLHNVAAWCRPKTALSKQSRR